MKRNKPLKRKKPLRSKSTLKRKTPLKSKTTLKGGGRLRSRSEKRQKQYDEEYKPRVKAFLEENDICQMCGGVATTVHHMAKRNGDRLVDESKWMALCVLCNGACEDMGAKAYELGFKERVNRKPEEASDE